MSSSTSAPPLSCPVVDVSYDEPERLPRNERRHARVAASVAKLTKKFPPGEPLPDPAGGSGQTGSPSSRLPAASSNRPSR